MNKINASVVIPSHRFDVSSMRRLILTVDMFLTQGFEVVIADNSGFFAKQQQLRAEFGESIVFAETEADCNAADNFLAGFSAASSEYVLFATDDDIFLPVGVQALANAIANSNGYAGFCAPTVRYAHEGISVAAVPELSSDALTERLVQWILCDIAVIFYGCYSQKIWRRYFGFIQQHPVKLAHHDQLLRFIIADAGHIATLNTAWFAYDYSNWSNGQTAQESLVYYYTKAGFDERMIYVHSVLEGLEGALCQLKVDELAGREFQYTAINGYWWHSWLAMFRQMTDANRDIMNPEVWVLLEPLVNYLNSSDDVNVYQILQLLTDFLNGIYGSDKGLQDFWLNQAADSLRVATNKPA
jgi:glycosyltransferase involved in cell wall biosynthesis